MTLIAIGVSCKEASLFSAVTITSSTNSASALSVGAPILAKIIIKNADNFAW